MYLILWEYQVKAEHAAEFERIYSPDGPWVKLFRRSEGYLGTQLSHDPGHPHHYLTLDRWASSRDYEAFLTRWKSEYKNLDKECEGLTERETLLGRWELLSPETE